MAKISAGLLMYRCLHGELQVLLAHPGGPFFQNKDAGAWSIPKGLVEDGENLESAARREFEEETGITAPDVLLPLTPITQKGGKTVYAWAFAGDCDPTTIVSNTFTMEWPPRSGREAEFPEIDRAEFFDLRTAREKINAAQAAFLNELERRLEENGN